MSNMQYMQSAASADLPLPDDGDVSPTPGNAPPDTSRELSPTTLPATARKGLAMRKPMIWLWRAILIAACLVSWQLLSGRVLPTYTISRPTAIVRALVNYLGSNKAWVDIKVTSEEYFIGLAIGVIAGLVVAMALGTIRLLGQVVEPMIGALNAVPVVALAPLFIIIFGIGISSKFVIAAVAVFFIMFYNGYVGIAGVDQRLIDTLRSFGAGRLAQMRYVIIPSIVPGIFAGLRVSVGIAMIGVLVGEFVASVNGVGQYITVQTQLFNSAGTFAGIIVAVAIVLLVRAVVVLAERRMMRWR